MLLFRQLRRQLQRQERQKDIRAARQMALTANCLAKRNSRKPFTPEDFMPRTRQTAEKPMDWQAMKQIAQDMTVALGGDVHKRKEG